MIKPGMLLVLLLLPLAAQAAPEIVAVPVSVDGKEVTLRGEYYRPPGQGKVAAVVLLHGCSGVGRSHRAWAQWLIDRGYAALVLDSFGGRGTKQVCTKERSADVAAIQRAGDARAAASLLAARPEIDGERLALIGFSHGGAATLFTALAITGEKRPPMPFKLAIAFYPDCTMRGRTTQHFTPYVPLLILVGEEDDWTPAQKCRELMPRLDDAPATVRLKIYPDAHHGFDSEDSALRYRPDVGNRNKPGGCCGATIGYNERAARDAQIEVEMALRQFLAARRDDDRR